MEFAPQVLSEGAVRKCVLIWSFVVLKNGKFQCATQVSIKAIGLGIPMFYGENQWETVLSRHVAVKLQLLLTHLQQGRSVRRTSAPFHTYFES